MRQTFFDVVIDDVPTKLSLHAVPNSNRNHYEYLQGKGTAHSFRYPLETYPTNTEIITNGHTYVILKEKG